MGTLLRRVTALERHVVLDWADELGPETLSWRWLTDHRPEDLDPATQQRRTSPCETSANLLAALATADDMLEVRWDDGSVSRYPLDTLRPHLAPGRELARWGASLSGALPAVGFDAVMSGERGLRDLLEGIERQGFVLVRGVPATAEDTCRLGQRIGYLRRTIFGDFWDFGPDGSHGDSAYGNQAIDPHTDGTYSHDPPGLQMFHCLRPGASGGHTVLVDGFEVAARLLATEPDAFRLLSETVVPAQYIGDGVHLRAEGRTFRYRGSELAQIRFNDADRAPFLPPEGFYDAWCALRELTLDPALRVRFLLVPGTALIFDNWRVLHGRERFEGPRRIVGCYHNREDFESRLRTLRTRTGSEL